MRNVEHWVRAVDRDEIIRVYHHTGNKNTLNQFLAPFYIVRNDKLNVRLTLSGDITEAIRNSTARIRYGLTSQVGYFNEHEITMEKGDVVVLHSDGTLMLVICGSVSYREVLFGMGYNYHAQESRNATHTAVSFSEKSVSKAQLESSVFATWWEKNGPDYTSGKYVLNVEYGAVFGATMGDVHTLRERMKFLQLKFLHRKPVVKDSHEEAYSTGELPSDTDDLLATNALFGDKQKADAHRNIFILQEINKAADGNVFDAWGCYQKLNHYHDVSKEEFAAKVKFLEFGLWKRFKFWLARN